MNEKQGTPSASTPGADTHSAHTWQTGHDVEFYATDDQLLPSVVDFLAEGVRAGQPIIVIATQRHRQAFAAGLRAKGIEIDDLLEGRDRVWLDAEMTLSAFMDGDVPNAELFEATVGNVFETLKARRAYLVVRAYGEMVDVLWGAGKSAAALELERLWNALAEKHSFWLKCAYARESLVVDVQHDRLHQLCAHHRKSVVRDTDMLRHFPVGLQARLGTA